ncbi:hypothetical protein TVAG_443420 [Trichomonas vaginalis G3]|uniref:Uncharacterized protein n=1 Tax=Trichomonas vaginalis (strain ATCC PRA-98 / G3) TaxID=412133 RepID=A2F3Q4_TRIV3|nr:hypothetical protein TVAGG3_0778000 [Trichomonas vaginalis G3]EAY00472.1 hypothetical protein TVAG_443420 [Trichomonas vaginalis G3]KAI5494856.1 hypothetical protein TVAGG3_0778000 [Trichomonas vaginalis G3]|eukprot:XP_001313401.1 hypothetical protein [Trichomonas vaginalis G3]
MSRNFSTTRASSNRKTISQRYNPINEETDPIRYDFDQYNRITSTQNQGNIRTKPVKRLVKNKDTFRKLVKYLDAKEKKKKDSFLAERPKWGYNSNYTSTSKGKSELNNTEQSITSQNISSISNKKQNSKKIQKRFDTPKSVESNYNAEIKNISPNLIKASQSRQKARKNIEMAQKSMDSIESIELDNETDSDSLIYQNNFPSTTESSIDYNLPQIPDVSSTENFQEAILKRQKINQILLDDLEESSSEVFQSEKHSKIKLRISYPISYTTSNALSDEIEKLQELVEKFRIIVETIGGKSNIITKDIDSSHNLPSENKVEYVDIDAEPDSNLYIQYDQNQPVSLSNIEESNSYYEEEEQINENNSEKSNEEEDQVYENNYEKSNEEEMKNEQNHLDNNNYGQSEHDFYEEETDNEENEEEDLQFDQKLQKVIIPSSNLPEIKQDSEEFSDFEERNTAWESRFNNPSSENLDIESSGDSNVSKEHVEINKTSNQTKISKSSPSRNSIHSNIGTVTINSDANNDEDQSPVRKTAQEWKRYFLDSDSDSEDNGDDPNIVFDVNVISSNDNITSSEDI